MKQKFIFLFFLQLCFLSSFSQELNCNVIINSEKVQTTEKSVFETMKKDLTNFLNNRKWTNDAFNPEERIKCNIFITLTSGSVTDGVYDATIQVQAVRPVFGTNYESIILNYLDKDFSFQYLPSQPMYFNENSFLSNLTSVLAYYAYIIIGIDYDSFSSLGGNPYFDKARTVLTAAMYSASGWDEDESNGRYWLQENLNSQQLLPFREGFYNYHRLAMDNFAEKPDEGRKQILEFLKTIKQVNILKPYSLVIRSFFTAKADELVNIYSKGDRKVREEASTLLRQLDPLNSEKYLKILR